MKFARRRATTSVCDGTYIGTSITITDATMSLPSEKKRVFASFSSYCIIKKSERRESNEKV